MVHLFMCQTRLPLAWAGPTTLVDQKPWPRWKVLREDAAAQPQAAEMPRVGMVMAFPAGVCCLPSERTNEIDRVLQRLHKANSSSPSLQGRREIYRTTSKRAVDRSFHDGGSWKLVTSGITSQPSSPPRVLQLPLPTKWPSKEKKRRVIANGDSPAGNRGTCLLTWHLVLGA